jgi:TonB family protein
MKNNIIALLLFTMSMSGYSQNPKIEYYGRTTTSVKQTELKDAQYLIDITEELWTSLGLRQEDRIQMDREIDPNRMTVFPPGNYSHIVDFVSVSITATCAGKEMSADSKDDKLTAAQKSILSSADLNTDIFLRIRFKFKNQDISKTQEKNSIREGILSVLVVPEIEAEYPGGFTKMSDYLNKALIDKAHSKRDAEKFLQARIDFTVNKEGQVIDPKIIYTTTDPGLDKLLLEAIRKMPQWKPAENPKGIRVKQRFSIPLGNYGC